MTSRRSFLRALLALPIAATLDVEKLLWVPGQLVTVPETFVPLWAGPWMFRVSNDPQFEFSFTGFKEGDEGTIVGQILGKGFVQHPRLQRQLFGVMGG